MDKEEYVFVRFTKEAYNRVLVISKQSNLTNAHDMAGFLLDAAERFEAAELDYYDCRTRDD